MFLITQLRQWALVLFIFAESSCRPRSKSDSGELAAQAVNESAFRAEYNTKRKIVSAKLHGQTVTFTTATLPIRLEFLSNTMVKIRYANRTTFGSEYTYSIAEQFKPKQVPIDLKEHPGHFDITTPQMKVVVSKVDGLLKALNQRGEEIIVLTNLFADPFEDAARQTKGKAPQKRILLGAEFVMHADDHFYGLGEKLRGQYDQSLDWRGRKRDGDGPGGSFGNQFDGADGAANGNVMVPFLLASRGAGLFLDNVYRSYWEFDDPAAKHWYAKVDCDQDWEASLPKCDRSEMRFYLIVADEPKGVLQEYAELTGRAIMPPRWLLGNLQSRYGYNHWSEVRQAAKSLVADGFPLDGIFLDLQWFGGVPGVHGDSDEALKKASHCDNRRIGSFQWSTSKNFNFSNARKHLSELKADGVHVAPIEEGYFDTCLNSTNSSNQNFSEGESKGFLARKDFASKDAAVFATGNDDTDGNFNSVGYFGQVGMVDTSDEKARKWFWSKHLPILKDGAAMFWTDLGEPERYRWWWKYSGGKWHQDIHNVWDLNRARSFFEGYAADLKDERPFLMSRSGYAGSQRYGAAIWSADTPAKLGWAAAQPSAHMNLAMSGIPYTTSDVGGFGGFPFSNGPQFTRWLQMEAFSVMVRSHGNTTANNGGRIVHPNGFGEPYTKINRRYLMWRETLVPYIYTHAREVYDTGLPVVRALALIWPKDSEVVNLGSEFLLGPSILVAPVLTGPNNAPDQHRDIYLPAGRWYDMHDGAEFDGNRWYRKFSAPLDKLPLFAKEGAILPKSVPVAAVSKPAWDQTRIFEIYPGRNASEYSLYDDDGTSNDYKNEDKNSSFARTQIKMTPSPRSVTVKIEPMVGNYRSKPTHRSYGFEVRLPQKPQKVTWHGAEVSIVDTNSAASFPLKHNEAQWHSGTKKLYVQFASDTVGRAGIFTTSW